MYLITRYVVINKNSGLKMRICIDPGHSCPPQDTGAVGIKKEEVPVNEVCTILINLLKAAGHTVLRTTPTNGATVTASLAQRVSQSNAFKADLFVSVHANAAIPTDKPRGTEVFYQNDASLKYATNIEKQIASLGFKSRGAKNGSFLYVVKRTQATSVLVELFFIDSKADCDLYDQLGPEKLAQAIASAIDATAAGKTLATTVTPAAPSNTETEKFICQIKEYCAKKGYDPIAFLAVRLFETGGSLAAGYVADQKRTYPAFGILQWTPAGCEPIQKFVGVPEAHTSENNIAAYLKVKGKSRLEQLDLAFKYFDYWEPLVTKKFPQFDKGGVQYQYVVTLSPSAGSNYKDGSDVTAKELINTDNFKSRLKEAEGMLNGTIPVPNDDGAIYRGPNANAAHMRRMGSQIVNPSVCAFGSNKEANVSTANTPAGNTEAKKSLEDLLPMSINISIPEYPRLVNLKPGDVIILPKTATYRDWVVTNVAREFNQGLNKLTIQAHRALAPKAFVQDSLLVEISDPMKYYWEPLGIAARL